MKKIMLICALLLAGVKGFCNTDNHVIIAVDLRSNIARFECDYTINAIQRVVPRILNRNNLNEGYASMHFFSADNDATNLNTYIKDIITPFTPYTSIRSVLGQLGYEDFVQHNGTYYSLISVATPYSLLHMRNKAADKVVKNTYIILVTDFEYNGNNDFYGEMKHVVGITEPTRAKIMDTVKEVQLNYFYKFIEEVTIYKNGRKGYISLFEAVPLQQYFAIETLLDFQHTITATRTKDGYMAKFMIDLLDNPNYRFLTSEAYMPIEGHDKVRKLDIGREEAFFIPKELVDKVGKDNLSLNFRTWVQLIDNVYNHTLLAPDGSKLHGSEGLNRTIEIRLEEDAKILGFIPLTDGLYRMSFWTANQHTAVTIWNFILILIFLGILTYIIWKSTKYVKPKPQNNDVTL